MTIDPMHFPLERANLGGRGGKEKAPLRTAPSAYSAPRIELKDVPALVVDDDLASAKLVAVVLQAAGCVVQMAHGAEEALAMLATFQPRLIVLDLILPLMSGLLLAQRLKADTATSEVVLIAVTAFNGPDAERVAREAGFKAYVRKPIDPLAFPQLAIDCLRDGQ